MNAPAEEGCHSDRTGQIRVLHRRGRGRLNACTIPGTAARWSRKTYAGP